MGVPVGVENTNRSPTFITIPVRSSTPLATNDVSYSMYSATVGVAAAATAKRMLAGVLELRLHIFTETTLNVAEGGVYTVVSAVVVMLKAPNLPVAILFSVNYLKSNSMLLGNLLHQLGN